MTCKSDQGQTRTSHPNPRLMIQIVMVLQVSPAEASFLAIWISLAFTKLHALIFHCWLFGYVSSASLHQIFFAVFCLVFCIVVLFLVC